MMRSKKSKKKALTMALKLAKEEADDGLTVLVLLPSMAWVGDIPLTYGRLEGPGTRYVRFSNSLVGLGEVAIDTLILVGSNDPAWDFNGEIIAREGLRVPQVIKVGEKP